MAGPPLTTTAQAGQALARLCGVGLVLTVVGGIVLAATWPGTEVGSFGGETKDTGSAALTVVGGLIAAAGNYMVLVALIGWGVRLGNLASRPPD